MYPRRKTDPSRYFPWKAHAERGFGLWCDSPSPTLPAPLDDAVALQALGYDIADVEAAIGAFKLHFLAEESSRVMNDRDRSVLHCLLRDTTS